MYATFLSQCYATNVAGCFENSHNCRCSLHRYVTDGRTTISLTSLCYSLSLSYTTFHYHYLYTIHSRYCSTAPPVRQHLPNELRSTAVLWCENTQLLLHCHCQQLQLCKAAAVLCYCSYTTTTTTTTATASSQLCESLRWGLFQRLSSFIEVTNLQEVLVFDEL
jgi:hypothetical protein